MPKYYFAVSGIAVDEDGNPTDAYMEVDFPVEVESEVVMKFAEEQMHFLHGSRLRHVSREEYEENSEDYADDDT